MNMKWFKYAGIRCVKTIAETALSLIGTNTIGITDIDWVAVVSASALSGLVCLLTCIASLPEAKM